MVSFKNFKFKSLWSISSQMLATAGKATFMGFTCKNNCRIMRSMQQGLFNHRIHFSCISMQILSAHNSISHLPIYLTRFIYCKYNTIVLTYLSIRAIWYILQILQKLAFVFLIRFKKLVRLLDLHTAMFTMIWHNNGSNDTVPQIKSLAELPIFQILVRWRIVHVYFYLY